MCGVGQRQGAGSGAQIVSCSSESRDHGKNAQVSQARSPSAGPRPAWPLPGRVRTGGWSRRSLAAGLEESHKRELTAACWVRHMSPRPTRGRTEVGPLPSSELSREATGGAHLGHLTLAADS